MELVACAFASQSRNYMCVGKHLRKAWHDVTVEPPAHTVLLFIFKFSGKKRNLFRIEIEILAEIVVDLLDSFRPERILRVGFTLMHEDTLDYTVLLGDLCHLDKSCIRIAAVLLDDGLHPVTFIVDVFLVIDLVPKFDLCSCN